MYFAASVAKSDESIPPLMKTPTGTSDMTCFSTARSMRRRVSLMASRGEIVSIWNDAGSQYRVICCPLSVKTVYVPASMRLTSRNIVSGSGTYPISR